MPIFVSIVNVYNFVIQNEFNEGDGLNDFPLGNPIMEWSLTDCTHPDFASWAYNVFKPFVKIEADNFKYGRLWRFQTFNTETYKFDKSKPLKELVIIPTKIVEIPPGEGKVILSILKTVIGPFANWAFNQPENRKKGASLLKLRDCLRELNFDPDPENEWNDIVDEN